MYNTQTRVNLALHRANGKLKRQRNHWVVWLGVLCCGLFGFDVALIALMNQTKGYHAPEDWMYGATLLPSNAGGYVLVAIVTFVVAVTITILCMNYREKANQQEEQE